MPDRRTAVIADRPLARLCGRASAPRFKRRRSAEKLLCRLRDRFAARRAQGVNAVVEFRVETAAADVERFQLVIDDGHCTLAERPLPPTATIEIELEDLAALIDGQTEATPLFMSQRLKVWGDLLLAVRLPDFFPAGP